MKTNDDERVRHNLYCNLGTLETNKENYHEIIYAHIFPYRTDADELVGAESMRHRRASNGCACRLYLYPAERHRGLFWQRRQFWDLSQRERSKLYVDSQEQCQLAESCGW